VTTIIQTALDVTAECLTAAEEVFEGWFDDDEPIDWHAFADRLDEYGWSLKDIDCPALSKIQRHVRLFKNP